MKERLAEIVRSAPPAVRPYNLVREYLQARILESLQRAGAMTSLAFHGGTALRFIYGIPRYSEDLDFTRELHAERYDLHSYLSTIESRFSAEGYQTSTKAADARPVHSAWIRFPGLLYELRLSPHPVETMSIKIEIDTNPPKGAVTTTTTVRRHVLLRLHHHDRATLLAGKINAILTRPYLKGRDVYDLVWYLSDPGQPPPNLKLLNNALRQFGWFREGGETVTDDITDHNWRHLLLDQFKETNWAYVVDDVRPLLEDQTEVELLALDTVQELVRGGARGR